MIHIYYLIGIAFIIYEIIYLTYLKTLYNYTTYILKRFNEVVITGKPLETSEVIKFYSYIAINLLFIIWAFLGLFTLNWWVFLGYLTYSLSIHLLLTKLHNKIKLSTIYLKGFHTLLGLALGVFTVLNHYHLHIDVTTLF